MPFMMGGANPNNFIPRGRSSPKGGNSTPKGKGKGAWSTPSGRSSNRGSGYKPKSFSSRGSARRGSYSFSQGAGSRGSLFDGGRNKPVHNTPPKGNTALTKGLGGAALTKAKGGGTLAKWGPLGLAAWLFFDIVTADGGLSDGTIPDHLRDVGEQKDVDNILTYNFTGEPGKRYSFHYRFKPGPSYDWRERVVGTSDSCRAPFKSLLWFFSDGNAGFQKEGFPVLQAAGKGSGTGRFYLHVIGSAANDPSIDVPYNSPAIGDTVRAELGTIELLKMVPVNESTEWETEENTPVRSDRTTNHNNTNPSRDPSAFPSGAPNPFPSDRRASPPPSKGFEKPQNKNSFVRGTVDNKPPSVLGDDNDNRARVEKPSAINTPAPEPPPPKKSKTPDNPAVGETYNFGEIEVEEEQEETEPYKSDYNYDYIAKDGSVVEVRTVKGADGTYRKVKTKKLTEEEIANLANKQKDGVEDKGWYSVNHSSFLDRYDPSVQKDIDAFKEEEPEEVIETEKSSVVNPETPKPSPIPEGNNTPEPDKIEPENTEETVTQTPPSKDPFLEKLDKLPDLDDIALTVAGLDIIKQIAEKAGTASPICTAEALRPAINRNNATTAAAQTAIIGQGQVTQNILNHPTWGLQQIVTNSSYGLMRIQSFASTAWRAARGDKIMAGVSMALTIHNAMMLSNNLASTISEALNVTFDALGIRDETDNPIDIGGFIRTKTSEILTSVLGAESYAALTTRIAKANRIYQASINLLDTTYSLFDSARTVAELTAENTGKIGNALRESGAVYEDAYNEFLEDINPQNASQRRLEKFREGIGNVEEAFDTVSQISSSIVETKDNIEALQAEKETWRKEVSEQLTAQATEKATAKEDSRVTTDINDADFDADTSDTTA